MHSDSRFFSANRIRIFVVVVLSVVFGANALQAQEATAPKRVLDFEGNKIFSNQELLEVANKCLAAYADSSDQESTFEYCGTYKVKMYLVTRGHLQARLGKPRQVQTENGSRTVISVDEGPLFRLGAVEIEGSKLLSPTQIREMFEAKSGDIANGESISAWVFERVKRAYGNLGYIQYTAEVQPKFHHKEGALEGVADLAVTIDEGPAFTIASIKFDGNGDVSKDALLREMTLRSGEVFSQEFFENSLTRISQNGQFETIDADRDVDFDTDQKATKLSLTIHLKKRVAGSLSSPLPQSPRRAIVTQAP